MILPLREHDITPGRLPWVTFGLMFAFSGLYLAAISSDAAYAVWGMVPAQWSFRTHGSHLLLHATWAHWLASVVLLLAVGAPLEVRWGRIVYPAFLAVAGLLSAGVYPLLTPESTRTLVGPSGALAAALGALLFEFRSSGVHYTWVAWLGQRRSGSFWVPVYAAAGLWFVCEVLIQLASRPAGPTRVGYWAQLAGFALGLAGAWTVTRLGLVSGERGEQLQIENAIRTARLAHECGDALEAFIQLERLAREYPAHPALFEALWESARDCGRADQVAPLLILQVQQMLTGGETDAAALRWCELDRHVPDLGADPRMLVQLAPVLSRMQCRREAARALRSALGDARSVSTGMALRIAELARDLHAPTAIRAAQRALAAGELHDAKCAKLQALVAELEARDVADDLELDATQPQEDRSIAIEIEDPLARPPGIPQAPPASEGGRIFELSADGTLEDSDRSRELSSELPEPPASTVPPAEPPVAVAEAPPVAVAEASPAAVAEVPPAVVAEASPAAPVVVAAASPAAVAEASPVVVAAASPVVVAEASPAAPVVVAAASPVVVAEASPAAPVVVAGVGPATAAQEARFYAHKVIEAVPIEFGAERLELAQLGGKRGHVEYRRIDAVSAAAVRGLADKPVILIDLVLNWTELESNPLRVIRLRSDTFDARPFAPGAAKPMDAFRKIVEMLLGRSRSLALPDPESAQGRPFRMFEDLATYHRDVLLLSD